MAPFRNVLIATQFLTRLPIPVRLQTPWTMEDLRDSVAMFPLVGVLVGLISGLVYLALIFSNLPPILAAILAVAAQLLITGALHEDGLADVFDGFGGGRTRERKLAIMRDSRLGSFGAVGLMISLALRMAAIAHLATPEAVVAALIAVSALSRAAMPVAMLLLPQAREDGLAASAGRPTHAQALAGIGIGLCACLLCLPTVTTVVLAVASAVVAGLFVGLSQRQIGGITGDVLGGLQQIVEMVGLAVVVATLPT